MLARKGVEEQRIIVCAAGDTQLFRPTGPGVREPLNRRTAVSIFFGPRIADAVCVV
jgi:hypothetical protein